MMRGRLAPVKTVIDGVGGRRALPKPRLCVFLLLEYICVMSIAQVRSSTGGFSPVRGALAPSRLWLESYRRGPRSLWTMDQGSRRELLFVRMAVWQ